MKFKAITVLLVVTALLLVGCNTSVGGGDDPSSLPETSAGTNDIEINIDTSEMFTTRDLKTDYVASECTAVQLSESSVNITQSGTYILSGTISNGQIIIDVADSDKVRLILNNVNITSASSAAIYVRSADKVFITTAEGSVNTLANGGKYENIDENNIDAVIFSKSDLTLNGLGTLNINAPVAHGIVSKDDLVLTSGTYNITSSSHALSGKDSIRISEGSYCLTSGKDGIHSDNEDDGEKGFIYISGGKYDITSDGDGISASAYLLIEGGSYNIKTGSGAGDAQSGSGNGGFGWVSSSDNSSVSCKGIKATSDIYITGGDFVLDSSDDAIHSDSDLKISGGDLKIATGDDGIHADSTLVINGGVIDITQSYEGIEATSLNIAGGSISIVASDDGLNAAGGNDGSGFGGFGGFGGDRFSQSSNALLNISGGVININAGGDGVDSNGTITVSGGELYVSGPTSTADGAIDYETSATITGGTVIAAGSVGMAENFSAGTQCSMLVNLSGTAGSSLTVTDSKGNVLLSWVSEKQYSCVVISSPDIKVGETYTVSSGSGSISVTPDSTVYGGGMGGGFGGKPGGDFGGNPGGDFGGNPGGDFGGGMGKDPSGKPGRP